MAYQKHQLDHTLKNVIIQLDIPPINIERSGIVKSLKTYAKVLRKHEIEEIPYFSHIFKQAKLKNKKVSDLLMYIKKKIKEENKLIQIKNRLFNKTNSSEKDLIFAGIICIYKSEIIEIFIGWIETQNLHNDVQIKLINDFKTMFNQINQKLLLNLNDLNQDHQDNDAVQNQIDQENDFLQDQNDQENDFLQDQNGQENDFLQDQNDQENDFPYACQSFNIEALDDLYFNGFLKW